MAPARHTLPRLVHAARPAALAIALTVLCFGLFPCVSFGAVKGVETDLSWGTTQSEQQQTVVGVKDLGAGWMRLTLSWHDLEPVQGTYDANQLNMFDTAIAAARKSGTKVLVTVYGAPEWASGRTEREA